MPTQLAPTVQLIHGSAIPALGFSTSPLQGSEAATAVRTAIETGYRLIDTAENYYNEDAVVKFASQASIGLSCSSPASSTAIGTALREYGAPTKQVSIDSGWTTSTCCSTWQIRTRTTTSMRFGDSASCSTPAPSAPSAHPISSQPSAAGAGRDRHRARCQPDTAEPPYDAPGQPRLPHEHKIVTESWSPIGASSDLDLIR